MQTHAGERGEELLAVSMNADFLTPSTENL